MIRGFAAALAFGVFAPLAAQAALALPAPTAPPAASPASRIVALEAKIGGRLGVAALDTGSGRRLEHRAGERFPMCSTFKLLLVGHVLSRVDAKGERLDRVVTYGEKDLVEWSPITKDHVADGMSVADLCAAAISHSDNTAGNLLLATQGGPQGLTHYARLLGDAVTRLDRIELELNTALPGDERDTTTPSAMLADMQALVLGDALTPVSRERLQEWLVDTKTGAARLRAGLPSGWRVGTKSGTGLNGATNDVAVVWPPGRAPILVAVYAVESKAPREQIEAAIAEVGRIVAAGF